MKKRVWISGALLALGVVGGGAMAATLINSGGSCPDGFIGTWHFVNNQTGGVTGQLTAHFSTNETCTTSPYKVLSSVNHYSCTAGGTLVSATTGNVPGRLVLSDFSCTKKDECVPTKDKPCD